MSFPINVNIPAAGNFPGDDQPLMKSNFANISGYLTVDHVLPGAVGDGFHKRVTFNSNNVPATPTSPPVLFTNTVAPQAIPQLYYYSGTSAQSSTQYTNAANYSTFLLGGLILKGGTTGNIVSGSTISYSTLAPALQQFPNGTLGVVLTPVSTNVDTFRVTALTATGFNINFTSTIPGTKNFSFIAIGY